MMSLMSTILVIDDEYNLRYTLALILRDAGYLVDTAENAGEALKRLKAIGQDLVILDLKLPDCNGLTLLNKIHSIKPGLPVLIITSLPRTDISEQLTEHGVVDYLEKPVEPVQILTRVRRILGSHA